MLAGLGYRGVGITLDAGHLDPYRAGREEVREAREGLRRTGLRPVVETGGRFVLDPRRKHWPSLVSAEGRERRIDFYRRAIEIGEALGAKVLSLWSGPLEPGTPPEAAWGWLVEGLRVVERAARERGMVIGFEPEPGMLVGDLAGWRELRDRMGPDPPPALKMTIDVGHLQCSEDPPHARWIAEFAGELVNVHLDDIRGREHQHLPPGDGEIDFPPLLAALEEARFGGLALVELGRHSHAAPETAARSLERLRGWMEPPSIRPAP